MGQIYKWQARHTSSISYRQYSTIMSNHRLRGKKAEDVACRFLEKNGLNLIERNYQCRFGEIDIIMQDSDTIVFIEVRYRQSMTYGGAEASVDRNKQQKLVFTANHYIQKHSLSQAMRFDVVAIYPGESPHWITDAFMEN